MAVLVQVQILKVGSPVGRIYTEMRRGRLKGLRVRGVEQDIGIWWSTIHEGFKFSFDKVVWA